MAARGTGTGRIKGWNISVTIGTATRTTNVKVMARNRRTGDYGTFVTDANSEVVINAGNLTDNGAANGTHNGFNNEDVIEIKTADDSIGHATVTIDTTLGGTTLTLTSTDVTATNAPGWTY